MNTFQQILTLSVDFHSEPQKKTTCTHCGNECQPAIDVTSVNFPKAIFCCDGCKTVYELLNENDLCYYYNINENAGVKISENSASFAYLDDPEISRQIIRFANSERADLVLEVPSMHCSSCIWLLENLFKLDSGILTSSVNFPRKEIALTFSPQKTSLSKVVNLLHRLGYTPRLNLDAGKEKNLNSNPELRKLTYKIGVAAFCFGNIMLLAFPDYLAGEKIAPGLEHLFAYLSLILVIPLFFYSASDYLRSAWNAVRMKRLHIDIPLAVGMASMFFRSAYEILSGTGMGFLDSLGGLVFFLLVGKFVQQKNYSFLSFERDFKAYFPLAVQVRRYDKAQLETVSVNSLRTGDSIFIKNDEIIPADSLLIDACAMIDYSFITGESIPQEVKKGKYVYAGGRNKGAVIELTVEKSVEQSHLTRLWNHPSFLKKKDTSLNKIINKINSYFTPVVIVLAFGSLFYHLPDVKTALNAFTAVLIIACPCALVLASPFTYGHITRILGNYGFYLKNADVTEKLAYPDVLVFDKTGTLTVNDSQKIEFISVRQVSDEEKKLISSLVRNSVHPFSRIAEEFFQSDRPYGEATDVKEFPGKGIEAVINGHRVKAGSYEFAGNKSGERGETRSAVYFQIDGNYIGRLEIRQNYRHNIENCLSKLEKSYRVEVLSGDNDSERLYLSRFVTDSDALHFRQTPEQKLKHIEKLQCKGLYTVMIGDGLNDAGALSQSNVGISVTENASRFAPASDAILDGTAINKLPEFLSLAKSSRKIIWICFFVSLTYNLTGTYFAVQGELSPVIAAILMPFSSIGIISVATALTFYQAKKRGFRVL